MRSSPRSQRTHGTLCTLASSSSSSRTQHTHGTLSSLHHFSAMMTMTMMMMMQCRDMMASVCLMPRVRSAHGIITASSHTQHTHSTLSHSTFTAHSKHEAHSRHQHKLGEGNRKARVLPEDFYGHHIEYGLKGCPVR
eukprot:scaffold138118_cov21-Tisochrysis_lutea.AAC.1